MNLKISYVILLLPDMSFELAFGTFLDDFRLAPKKSDLLKDPVKYQEQYKVECAILAATAHKLANDNNLPIPEWVYQNHFTLSEPVYTLDTKNEEFRIFLEKNGPKEFRERNIFYGENVLNRA